ncbi:MAG: ROK family protein [Acidimicrobiales bacterium]
MIAGLDVGGTKVNALLIDPATGVVHARRRASSDGSGSELVDTIGSLVAQLDEAGSGSVDAIGLGIAGLASRSGVVRYSPNLPRLVEFPIGSSIESATGRPVVVGNDASTAAWAEARFGAGRDVSDFVFVALGTGIGVGVVANGDIVLGGNGFAGEAGHMVIDLDGPTHHTGQQGPWEYFASGSALGRLGREAAADGHFDAGLQAAGTVDALTGVHVSNAVAVGDAQALQILDEFCHEVARGAANLVMLLDPRRIVLGGGLTDIGEPLRAGVAAGLAGTVLGADHRPEVEVVMAELGADAGAVGAGLLAARRLG